MLDNKETIITPTVYKGYNCYQVSTGEIGMTKQALADVCKVSVPALNYIIKNMDKETYAPWLTPFVGHSIILVRKTIRTKPTAILKWEFCTAVIDYFQSKDMALIGSTGMTKQALADICKVSVTAIDYVIKNIGKESYAPWLTPFIGQSISLTCKKNPAKATIILKQEFCSAVIEYYRNKERELSKEVELVEIVYKGYNCYQTPEGEIGMSKLNLAKACNVHESAIDHLLRYIRTQYNVPTWLASFTDYDVILTRKSRRGGASKIIFKWDFCCTIIKYYCNLSSGKILVPEL